MQNYEFSEIYSHDFCNYLFIFRFPPSPLSEREQQARDETPGSRPAGDEDEKPCRCIAEIDAAGMHLERDISQRHRQRL